MPNYNDDFFALNNMAFRLHAHGGDLQQERMIHDKK
jgi:hypothetical protein